MLRLVTPPTVLPVSLATAKLHLRVDGADEDALITAMLQSAAASCEHETSRALTTQTWERVLDAFPAAGGAIALGMPPVVSIDSVTYRDPAGASQTLAPSAYSLDTVTEPGWLLPAVDQAWPDTQPVANAVVVRFTCGVATPAEVPPPLASWILLQVGALYRNREAFAEGRTVAELPNRFTAALLDRYRVHWRPTA